MIPSFRLPAWSLWDHRRSVIVFVLGLDAIALGLLAATPWMAESDDLATGRLLVLCVAAVLFEEIGRGVARIILRLRGTQSADMTSVWLMVAIILLPLWEALLFATAFRVYLWFRQHRPSGRQQHREIFVWSSSVVSATFAYLTLHALSAPNAWITNKNVADTVALLAAIAVLFLVNTLSVAIVIRLSSGPQKFSQLIGDTDQNLIELATLCLGALAARAGWEQPLLIFLAIPLTVALQRASLVTQLTQDATTDPKTGLLNATTWHRVGTRELARAEREDEPVAVLIFDLDHFKQVNDTWGHLVGDQAIVAMAELLRRELREYDTVARFGGEEFVALLPSTSQREALTVAERVRRQVTLIRLETMQQPGPRLSVSAGVACFPDHGITMDQLLQAADTALYSAKHGGRDQVVVARRDIPLWPSGQAAS